MFNQLLTASDKITLGDAALYATLGFIVVFVGIAFLIAVVSLVGKFISRKKEAKTAPVVIPTAPAKTEERNDDDIDDETVAVIMAALMAYYQTNNPKCEFTVKRIKRI